MWYYITYIVYKIKGNPEIEVNHVISEKQLLQELISVLQGNDAIKKRYEADINRFQQNLEYAKLNRYRLGVIGVTSSGKSTLINAIMKKELLSMAVRPSSSQLVTCSKSTQDQVTVYFEDKPPEIRRGPLLSQVIAQYSDERFNPGNKLKVKQLELSAPGYSLPEEVLLIDSPGLDAFGYEGHEKLTLNSLLPTVDFCIYVTTVKANCDAKMKSILDIIADYDKPVIIVQNMIDAAKPSPDGKKDVSQVLKEHRFRVQRVVNQSKIQDQASVKIVQVSAKNALLCYGADKGKSAHRDEKLWKESNFQALIDAVNAFFAEISPRIEWNRFSSVRNEIKQILDEARQDMEASEEERRKLVFPFAGDDNRIRSLYREALKKLQGIVQKLQFARDRYQSQPEDEPFNSVEFHKIKKQLENSENDLIAASNSFRERIEEYCNRFNVDSRQVAVIGSYGALPVLTLKMKQVLEKVEKSGLLEKLKRFLGNLFDQPDWGYDDTLVSQYDHDETVKMVVFCYDSRISVYSQSCEQWQSSASGQVNQLLSSYQSFYESFEARKRSLPGREQMEPILTRLEKLLRQIPAAMRPAAPANHFVGSPYAEAFPQAESNHIRVDRMTYSMIKLAEIMHQRLHHQIVKAFLNCTNKRNITVIGFDADSTERFIHNSFCCGVYGLPLGVSYPDGLTVLLKPSEKDFRFIVRPLVRKQRLVFILFNASQFGSGLSDLKRIEIEKHLTEQDQVCFVIQDLAELITGNGLDEGMTNMLNIRGQYPSLPANLTLLANHNNPVYNLVIAELQKNPCITQQDEVNLMHTIQKQFGFLTNPEIEKHLHIIMDAFRKQTMKENYHG